MATKSNTAKASPKLAAAKKEMSVTNYILMMAAITILALLAGGYFGYVMVKANIQNGKVLIGKVKAQEDVKQKLENAKSLVENYNRMSDEDKELIAAALPENPDFTQLISLMETANTSAGTRMKSISSLATEAVAAPVAPTEGSTGAVTTTTDPSGQQPGSNSPSAIRASTTVEGNYSQFTQYFRNLELSVRPLRVQTIDLKGNSGSLKGDITIETFYQGPADYSDKEEVVQ